MNKWKCSVCGCINSEYNRRCFNCNCARQKQSAFSDVQTVPQHSAKKSVFIPIITVLAACLTACALFLFNYTPCFYCGYINPVNALRCEKCDQILQMNDSNGNIEKTPVTTDAVDITTVLPEIDAVKSENLTPKPTTAPTPTPIMVYTGSLGNNNIYVQAGKTVRVKFTAPSAGTYVFSSTGSSDTVGYLYASESTATYLVTDDDSGSYTNFKMQKEMYSGEVVYIGMRYFLSDKEGYINLQIIKSPTPTTAPTPKPTTAPTPTPIMVYTGSLGNNNIYVQAGKTVRVKFTAPSAGTYVFSSTGSSDTFGYLYASESTIDYLDSDDDSGSGHNFKLQKEMYSGEVVYIGVEYLINDKEGYINLNISEEAKRTFALDSEVIPYMGAVTVHWEDSANKAPYTVRCQLYQYVGNNNAVQTWFWAGGDQSGSTTYDKQLTMYSLIPGKSYRIEVTDCDNNSIQRCYVMRTPSNFEDRNLEAASIKVSTSPRRKKSSESYSSATEIASLSASDIVANMYEVDYGVRYNIEYPEWAYERRYLTQVAITAPNGYMLIEECDYFDFNPGRTHCWYMLGDDAFKEVYKANGVVPRGTWTIDLYWDGMHVNTTTFEVR